MKIYKLLPLLLLFALVSSDDQGDWVDVFNLLPFHVHPFYAGFLRIPSGKNYFYVYHPSESNPSKDPVVVRISAGPGCSPLYSWLYSKGTFIFNPYTDNFRINPFNWNKQANVLFIEGPSGVGFSYSDDKNKTQTITDKQFAFENLEAIFAFYNKFPERKDQQLYLTGEQYAGTTIPILAELIVNHNNNDYTPAWSKINLKGFLVENPCTLRDECESDFEFTKYTIDYLKNHYYISTEKYDQYVEKCFWNRQGCQQIIHQIENSFVTTGSDIQNIYKQCVQQTGPQKYKCMDTVGILNFLNNKQVQEDLHVSEVEPDFSWDLCNLEIMKNFVRDHEAVQIYQKLLKEEHNLRIWVVSGVQSATVPVTGTRQWLEQLKLKLGLPMIRPWTSWKYDTDINAGEVEEIKGLTFATVRSAGMRIYQDQPEIGYHVINSFIKGKAL